ncbi:NADH:flavin oxidoreductase/NADH oxidase family protein [Zavarzinia compransoris]|uniref:NADH:flavin oxidoreductase/NADH oxidase family protein n=1 Tax=Zavarzinia marina TaxID=2911065 RepID=UPI001F31F63F|nr:NADH:flavin oxidoreductase/NADH oxidase family protein [Zavarzinia marina]MCF4167081.1 NADH:flavin oxidoreductase/NADH oxidase family protein [Zavarzinia marina]
MAETETIDVTSPLTLPCGLTLKNRLAKAAMTEGLADTRNRVTPTLETLYKRFAEGGCGLLITGNIQVHPDNLERAANVVVAPGMDQAALDGLRRFAEAGRRNGTALWGQISHAGRQTPIAVNKTPQAPSAIALPLPGKQFGVPKPMTEAEIQDVVSRFAFAARTLKEAGFDGVQIHGAHGYLISQFLSPRANARTDAWGGSLENRARLLLEVVRAVRAAVGPGFGVGVKLNSADFMKGGFGDDEAVTVARWLEAEGIDLLEISGGSYERPIMMGNETMASDTKARETRRASTIAREAYFMDYARTMRAAVRTPLMVTGGFRSRAAMDEALASGACDLIGLARPLCVTPAAPLGILDGSLARLDDWESRLRVGPGRWLGPASPLDLVKLVNGFGAQGWFCLQLMAIGEGREPNTGLGVLPAFIRYQIGEARSAKTMLGARKAAGVQPGGV